MDNVFYDIETNKKMSKDDISEYVEADVCETSTKRNKTSVEYVITCETPGKKTTLSVTKEIFDKVSDLDTKILLNQEGEIVGYTKTMVTESAVKDLPSTKEAGRGVGTSRYPINR